MNDRIIRSYYQKSCLHQLIKAKLNPAADHNVASSDLGAEPQAPACPLHAHGTPEEDGAVSDGRRQVQLGTDLLHVLQLGMGIIRSA